MRIFFTILLCLGFTLAAQSRERLIPMSLSVFNNGTSLPGAGYAGVFSKTIHPGICLGTSHVYRQRPKHEWYQSLKLGYFYHRHAQHALQLYSELGYRYLTKSSWYAEVGLGLGYLHAFADVQQFKLEDGVYRKKANWGRPQLMASMALSAGYDLSKKTKMPLRLFLQYQFWLQTPFVNKYVPLLPNTALHVGVVYTLAPKNK